MLFRLDIAHIKIYPCYKLTFYCLIPVPDTFPPDVSQICPLFTISSPSCSLFSWLWYWPDNSLHTSPLGTSSSVLHTEVTGVFICYRYHHVTSLFKYFHQSLLLTLRTSLVPSSPSGIMVAMVPSFITITLSNFQFL